MIRYATFGRRFGAVVLDALVDLLVLAFLGAIVGGGELAGPFAFWYLIHHVGLVCEGGSLGHRLLGLRIVRLDGDRVRVPHAIVREIARVCLSLPPLGLGFLWMLDERDRRCWHDIIGGTVVVHELSKSAVAGPAWATAPPWRTEHPSATEPEPERQVEPEREAQRPPVG